MRILFAHIRKLRKHCLGKVSKSACHLVAGLTIASQLVPLVGIAGLFEQSLDFSNRSSLNGTDGAEPSTTFCNTSSTVARDQSSCCGDLATPCCCTDGFDKPKNVANQFGENVPGAVTIASKISCPCGPGSEVLVNTRKLLFFQTSKWKKYHKLATCPSPAYEFVRKLHSNPSLSNHLSPRLPLYLLKSSLRC